MWMRSMSSALAGEGPVRLRSGQVRATHCIAGEGARATHALCRNLLRRYNRTQGNRPPELLSGLVGQSLAQRQSKGIPPIQQ
jgi:hypothetical protein